MKFDLDCVRDVLLELEKLELGQHTNVDELCIHLPKHSKDTITYTCLKLVEGEFIKAYVATYLSSTVPEIVNISDITFNGHQFIANIRNDGIWKKTKNILGEIGTTSISGAASVASQVFAVLIQNHLGLL